MADHQTNTGTGADLLSYREYVDATGEHRLTRVATCDEKWVVSDWDGETYYVTFANNFSKKHLATFSKSRESNEVAAYYAWLESTRGGTELAPHEAWERGEHHMAESKMQQTLTNRRPNVRCRCGHRYNQHAHRGPGQPKGACSVGGCGCARYTSPYAEARINAGKALEDNAFAHDAGPTPNSANRNPLAGATTNRNTFILLNYVPRDTFKEVVVRSLQAVEKPPGWSKGDPLAKARHDEAELKWDFGPAHLGAVVQMQVAGNPPVFTMTKMRGCWVKARKTATDWGKQTWEIFHMETGGAHAPF